MTVALVGTLAGIALFDSLNPSLFIAQLVLFTLHRPAARVSAYILGVLTVNLIFGIILVSGLRAVLSELIGDTLGAISPQAGWAIQSALALLLIGIGVYLFRRARKGESAASPVKPSVQGRQPANLWAAYLWGMVVMVQEMTTAFPLVLASERIASAGLDGWVSVLLLLGYNLIFALPLIGFLVAFMALRARFTERIDGIIAGVNVWVMRLTRWLLLIAGIIWLGWVIVQIVTYSPISSAEMP